MKSLPNRLLDEIEAQIVMGRDCRIRFKNEFGALISLDSRITKLYEDDGQMYVLIDSNLRLPVEGLIDVNGVGLSNSV